MAGYLAMILGAVAGLLVAGVAIERDLKRRRAWRRLFRGL